MACDGDSANGGRAAIGPVPGRRCAGEAVVCSPGHEDSKAQVSVERGRDQMNRYLTIASEVGARPGKDLVLVLGRRWKGGGKVVDGAW